MKTNAFSICLASILFAAGFSGTFAAEELPRGVPRTIWPDGSVYVDPMFTTREFQREALRLVVQEANLVARQLNLPERLPITERSLTHAYVGPFGFTYAHKAIGNVTTSSYCYGAEQGNKFSELVIANYDRSCLEYREKHRLPLTKMDTNSAYLLATQWLAALSMDVAGLNRDCKVLIQPNTFWNDSRPAVKGAKQTFVPIYDVFWLSAQNQAENFGDVVMVEFFAPTKTLLQLSVRDPKYILRKPLVFTNLAALFPQTNAPITVVTNWPKTQYVPGPPP